MTIHSCAISLPCIAIPFNYLTIQLIFTLVELVHWEKQFEINSNCMFMFCAAISMRVIDRIFSGAVTR